MESQVRKRTAATSEFACCALGHIEKVAFGQEVLLAIYLQKAFTLQDHACHIHLRVDV